MATTLIEYRGATVTKGWPKRIQQAQTITTYRPNGQLMERVRYGAERDGQVLSENPCHDCGVVRGEFHVEGCDAECCPACGGQILMGCDCNWSDKKKPEKSSKPTPVFSKREETIVAARLKFRWHHVRFAENGDALFEVSNESDLVLPFLSIGVQGRGGMTLVGGVWLDVSSIAPGSSGLVQKDCYKDSLNSTNVEFFPKPAPTPETKSRYWEFQKRPKTK